MQKILIYDDTIGASEDARNLLKVNRFSQVYYRKRSLERWMSDIATAAGFQFVKLDDAASRAMIGRLSPQPHDRLALVYVQSCMAFACPEADAVLFLRKLGLTRSPLVVQSANEAVCAAVGVDDEAAKMIDLIANGDNPSGLWREAAMSWHTVADDVGIIDLRDPLAFTDYLTSNFDVRFFNSIQSDNDFVVVKRSTEKGKLKREFQYYGLVPPAMRMFFIQPYDYQDDGGHASYKMERLFVPDMALQWIHGSLERVDFERFLDKVFYFLSIRPKRHGAAAQAKSAFSDAFRTKVQARRDQLLALPEYAAIRPYVDASLGGMDALLSRYTALLAPVENRIAEVDLCVGHGDLCFSNILYSKTTGLLRLIDPRGADSDDDLYMTPYYDLAKLSHSVVGSYDYINHGLFRLEVDHDLKLDLQIDSPPPPWARQVFEQKLRDHGFDPYVIRVLEASLFLSMVPLHIDAPRKVLAFLANADSILTELEGGL